MTSAACLCMTVGRDDTVAGGVYAQGVMGLCFCSGCEFGQAKVPKLDVTTGIIEDVGRFEILSVHIYSGTPASQGSRCLYIEYCFVLLTCSSQG